MIDYEGANSIGETCRWTLEDEQFYGDTYASECGRMFSFDLCGPTKHDFTYCPYCGRPIATVDNIG